MYEWEGEINKKQIEINIIREKEELSRILNVTLRGNFKLAEDREYWVKKAKQISSKISAAEEMLSA